ncbi:MAG: ABC transporter substrate-binding protein [Brevinemataceae bacterium]
MKKILIFIAVIITLIILPERFSKKKPLPIKIEKVVTLSPAHTRIIDYLALEQYIVGVSMFDENPNYKNIPKISGGIVINIEDTLALKPDLITIGDFKNSPYYISLFNSQGINTLVLKTTSFEDIYYSLIDIQALFSKHNLSNKISQFKDEWEILKNNPVTNRKNVLMIIGLSPIFAVGPNNYLDEMMTYAGWDNVICTDSAYPVLTEEKLLLLTNIDIIVAGENLLSEKKILEQIKRDVKAKELIFITNKNYMFPSPYLIDVIKEIRTGNVQKF